jgi:hypothetical protein
MGLRYLQSFDAFDPDFHGRNAGLLLELQAVRDCATIRLSRLGRRLTSLRENNVWVTYYSPGIW